MVAIASDITLRSVQFSDTAVFGRVSEAFQAYLDRANTEDRTRDFNLNPLAVFAPVSAYFERRRMVKELNGLSDRLLEDIGMTRADLML